MVTAASVTSTPTTNAASVAGAVDNTEIASNFTHVPATADDAIAEPGSA